MEKLLLEDLITPDFPYHKIIPTEQDFQELAELFVDEDIKRLAWVRFVDKAKKIINNDKFKLVRWLIACALFKEVDTTIFIQPLTSYLIDSIKGDCIRAGYNKAELKLLIDYAKGHQEQFENYYEKYCIPVINGTYKSNESNSLPDVDSQSINQNQNQQISQNTTNTVTANTNSTIKINANTTNGGNFYRIVAYDPKYKPAVRRHIYLTKKQGNNYKVSVGGAAVTSWYNEPFFDSIAQATAFINNIDKASTKTHPETFEYNIIDKPIMAGTNPLIWDLGNTVLIDSDCGPAYIHRKNNYCVESLLNNLVEDIEKHDTLNPKLFDKNNSLKKEVREKILEIVDEFIEDLTADEVELNIDDIILIGSNVSYNYTKDSDLDIHIVAETKSLKCPENLINALYSAYRSLFNKKFDIDFYGIPVELYVETENSVRVSNGVYSVKSNKWIKEPEIADIPELDKEAFDKLYNEWEIKCKKLIKDIRDDKLNDEVKVVKMIEDIYNLRKSGIADGEYSLQNLVFKELRNNKFLDDLKDYKNELIAKRLSLQEALIEDNPFNQEFPNIIY